MFALLQGSFLTHFTFFGAIPNLVFILFFLLVFFEKFNQSYEVVLLSLVAGGLLDVISPYKYIGPSVILLVLIGILLKKAQSALKNKDDGYPYAYFLPLFVVFLLAYELSLGLYLFFIDPAKIVSNFGLSTIINMTYNSVVASIMFYIYKKCQKYTG